MSLNDFYRAQIGAQWMTTLRLLSWTAWTVVALVIVGIGIAVWTGKSS